ncbi:MAG: restriction endonuclease subunit S, partial [Cuspidothrix sp.]
VYIPKEDYERLIKYKLCKNDILVSVVGTLGNAAIVTEEILPAIFSCKSTVIRCTDEIKPNYLLAYLNSELGSQLLLRRARGAIQAGLNLDDLKTTLIYLADEKLQTFIQQLVNYSKDILKDSKIIYQQAEELLLSELNLKDWQPTEENIAVRSFSSSFLASWRLDAEYYQPKYDDLEKTIKSYNGGWDYLGNKFLVETGEYSEEYVPKSKGLQFYIRNTNIKSSQIESDDDFYVEPKNFTKFTNIGDILTARVGAIGSFGTINIDFAGAIYSDNVLCLRIIQPQLFVPDVYTLYFNTKINRELMNRFSGGSVQPLITQTNIKNLPIPIFNILFQNEVNEKIQESFKFKSQSKQLLEIAKIGVEKAIESDETTATNWINEQLAALGINFL